MMTREMEERLLNLLLRSRLPIFTTDFKHLTLTDITDAAKDMWRGALYSPVAKTVRPE